MLRPAQAIGLGRAIDEGARAIGPGELAERGLPARPPGIGAAFAVGRIEREDAAFALDHDRPRLVQAGGDERDPQMRFRPAVQRIADAFDDPFGARARLAEPAPGEHHPHVPFGPPGPLRRPRGQRPALAGARSDRVPHQQRIVRQMDDPLVGLAIEKGRARVMVEQRHGGSFRVEGGCRGQAAGPERGRHEHAIGSHPTLPRQGGSKARSGFGVGKTVTVRATYLLQKQGVKASRCAFGRGYAALIRTGFTHPENRCTIFDPPWQGRVEGCVLFFVRLAAFVAERLYAGLARDFRQHDLGSDGGIGQHLVVP